MIHTATADPGAGGASTADHHEVNAVERAPDDDREPNPMTQLACGSYNLKNGGIDHGDDRRLRRQLAMLAGIGADAWFLQECKHWTDDGAQPLRMAEEQLGMTGYLAESAHHGCHLAIFVREPAALRVTRPCHESGPPYWHAVARVEAEAGGLPRPLFLASYHLAPGSPTLRLVEAEAFGLIAEAGLLIAMGDANGMPCHDTDPPPSARPAGHVRRKLDRRAAQAMEDNGLLDVGALCGDQTPTIGHEPGGLKYRCDRCYTNLPPETIISHRVITCADPDSDHDPFVCVFDFARYPAPGPWPPRQDSLSTSRGSEA